MYKFALTKVSCKALPHYLLQVHDLRTNLLPRSILQMVIEMIAWEDAFYHPYCSMAIDQYVLTSTTTIKIWQDFSMGPWLIRYYCLFAL